jgi:hypothetical protein
MYFIGKVTISLGAAPSYEADMSRVGHSFRWAGLSHLTAPRYQGGLMAVLPMTIEQIIEGKSRITGDLVNYIPALNASQGKQRMLDYRQAWNDSGHLAQIWSSLPFSVRLQSHWTAITKVGV